MTEYTVHFQKGTRVGTRRVRMVAVTADTVARAIKLAKVDFNEGGFRVVRVDHYDEDTGRMAIDY